VIEIMTFRLAEGADEEEFLQADRKVQAEFAYQQPGLMRRTTARGPEGDWIVVDLWQSADDADACAKLWDLDPVSQLFMGFVDRSSVRTARYFERD
jgi:hypothetical protein